MRSFGMWYKLIDKKKGDVSFETHFNLWFLEDHKGLNPPINNPYLDIGIRIEHYTNLDSLTIGLPFIIRNTNNIEDLSDKFENKENAQLIFNENCEVATLRDYKTVKMNDNDVMLIFPTKQDCGEIFVINKIAEATSSKIIINFIPFLSYADTVEELRDIENKCKFLYLRFRIKGINLKDIAFYDSESLNKSFESAFSATRVLDFKINKSRNIENKLIVNMATRGYSFVKFTKINFLIMVPSSYNLEQYSDDLDCREVENGLWDDYFGQAIDFHKGHVLAYHWKKKAESNKTFEDFSCFAKINYKKTRTQMLIAYCLVVISLGMFGSAMASTINNTYAFIATQMTKQIAPITFDKGNILALMISVIFFFFAIWLGSNDG